jgi:putative phosphoesterase
VRRVAVLSDVHGNLPALEAVLMEVEAARPDLLVFCGDLAAGPMPAETLDVLMALPSATRWVMGNADRHMLAEGDAEPAQIQIWTREQLTPASRAFLAAFESTVRLTVDGIGEVLFCHGSPRSDEEIITAGTPDDVLREILAGVEADMVVGGNTHMQFDRRVDGNRFVNAGSVGMPYGEPGAYWTLLGPDVDFRRTEYDRPAAAERFRERGYPNAESFSNGNMLTVPTAEVAVAAFERMAGRGTT